MGLFGNLTQVEELRSKPPTGSAGGHLPFGPFRPAIGSRQGATFLNTIVKCDSFANITPDGLPPGQKPELPYQQAARLSRFLRENNGDQAVRRHERPLFWIVSHSREQRIGRHEF
jgi:hypothetical protein